MPASFFHDKVPCFVHRRFHNQERKKNRQARGQALALPASRPPTTTFKAPRVSSNDCHGVVAIPEINGDGKPIGDARVSARLSQGRSCVTKQSNGLNAFPTSPPHAPPTKTIKTVLSRLSRTNSPIVCLQVVFTDYRFTFFEHRQSDASTFFATQSGTCAVF